MKTKVTSPGDVKVGNILSFVPNKEDVLYPIWKGLPLWEDIPSYGIDLVYRTNQPFRALVLQKKLLPNYNGRESACERFIVKLLIDGHIRYVFSNDLAKDEAYEFYVLTRD